MQSRVNWIRWWLTTPMWMSGSISRRRSAGSAIRQNVRR